MNKSKRGITLIALVITIIVLLILAAISITMLTGDNNILKRAADAKIQAEIGQEKEIVALAYNSALAKKISNGDSTAVTAGDLNNELDSSEASATGNTTITIKFKNGHTYIIKSNGEIEEKTIEEHNWQRNGDELTCAHCNKTVYIGKVVNYESNGNLETSIGTDKSGFTEIQYLSDSSPVWVVLGREDSDGDSKYETLLLTTEKPVISDQLYLNGATAYNNYIGEANRMAKELYGEEARAMTIEDVNNCLQYNPPGAEYQDSNYNLRIVNFNTLLRDLTDIWNNTNGIGTTNLTPDGSILGDNQLSCYSYHISELTKATEIEKSLIFGNQKWNYSYFLASRGIGADKEFARFGISYVGPWNVSICGRYLFSSKSGESRVNSYFRCVVCLTTEIPEIVRDGDFSTTYYPFPD